MKTDLNAAIKSFDDAMKVTTFERAKTAAAQSTLATLRSQHADEALLSGRLEVVRTNYDRKFRCDDRDSPRERVINWVSTRQESRTYWIYGLPGIGKTSLAHSICATLHDKKWLAGAFFCRRDDEGLSDHKNILPTLIHKLAGTFPPFRTALAAELRDPHLTPGTMKLTFLRELICTLPRQPKRPLVFVIDELDACGDSTNNRTEVLQALADAAAGTLWLKIIIISRPERDILAFFDKTISLSHERYDLAEDKKDLQDFTKEKFKWVVAQLHPSPPWPEPSHIEGVTSRAEGLFIFIDTIVDRIIHSQDPKLLGTMLEDPRRYGWPPLYERFLRILKKEIRKHENFNKVIGVLIIASRALHEEELAKVAEVRPSSVRLWVALLSSLLYRTTPDGGIRVRHSSVSDFLEHACHEDYRADVAAARVLLDKHFKKTGEKLFVE